ncbi:MAG: hypothetical protein ACYTEK_26790 [Planctomycetota bacterium]|jgi:protein-L-isoaspartate O-methyltransferase
MIEAMYGRENRDKFAADRERMLRWDLRGRDITDPRVLAVMAEIPREWQWTDHLAAVYCSPDDSGAAGQSKLRCA